MRNFDFSPLFRSSIGFDHMSRLMDTAMQGADNGGGYPPYNIEKLADDDYRITIAVAGFERDEIEITQKETSLVIRARTKAEDAKRVYLHRGIAGRAFERTFELADHINVVEADLENGLLIVALKREVPEALKARNIKIGAAAGAIDSKAA